MSANYYKIFNLMLSVFFIATTTCFMFSVNTLDMYSPKWWAILVFISTCFIFVRKTILDFIERK